MSTNVIAFAATAPSYDELLQRTVNMIGLHGLQALGLRTEKLSTIQQAVYGNYAVILLGEAPTLTEMWLRMRGSGDLVPGNLFLANAILLTSAGGLAYATDTLTSFYTNDGISIHQIGLQVQLFRKLIMGQSYRNYFSVFEAGFWGNPHTASAQAEYLYFVNCSSMKTLYLVAGFSNNGYNALTDYENNLIDEETLLYNLYLNNMSDLVDIAGAGWFASSSIKRRFTDLGLSITMDEARAFVLDSFDAMASLNGEELETLIELEDALQNGGITILDIDKIVLETLLATSGDQGTYNMIKNATPISTVYGTASNNIIYGDKDFSNNIIALAGNDIIVGLSGDDAIDGGSGSNYYVWYIGDGNDTIAINASSTDFNGLIFGEYVNSNDISFETSGYDLLIHHTPPDDVAETITISDWFTSATKQLSQIRFLGESVEWSNVEINTMIENSFVGGF